MSLKISNKLTAKQRAILLKLDYVGKWDITVDEAAKIIDELFNERDYNYGEIQGIAGDYYGFPIVGDYSFPAGLDDEQITGWK